MSSTDNLIKLVSINDPALDHDAMGGMEGIAEYAETRDYERVRVLPGMQPMVFHCRPIPQHLVSDWIRQVPGLPDGRPSEAQCVRAFRCAVVAVENQRLAEGYVPGMKEPKAIGPNKVMADEAAELFEYMTQVEIGGVALMRALFHLSTGVRSPAPPMSLERLEADVRRRAAASPSLPAQGSETASSDSAPTP